MQDPRSALTGRWAGVDRARRRPHRRDGLNATGQLGDPSRSLLQCRPGAAFQSPSGNSRLLPRTGRCAGAVRQRQPCRPDPARLAVRRQTADGAAAQRRPARRHCRSRRQERAGGRRSSRGAANIRRSRFEPRLCRLLARRLHRGRCTGRRQREGTASAAARAGRDRHGPALARDRSRALLRRAVESVAHHVAAGGRHGRHRPRLREGARRHDPARSGGGADRPRRRSRAGRLARSQDRQAKRHRRGFRDLHDSAVGAEIHPGRLQPRR